MVWGCDPSAVAWSPRVDFMIRSHQSILLVTTSTSSVLQVHWLSLVCCFFLLEFTHLSGLMVSEPDVRQTWSPDHHTQKAEKPPHEPLCDRKVWNGLQMFAMGWANLEGHIVLLIFHHFHVLPSCNHSNRICQGENPSENPLFLRRNLEKHLRICEFSMASLDHVRFARPLPCVFGIGRSRCANHGVSISQVLHFGHSIIKGVWMCGGKSILSLPDFLSWCDAAGFAIHVVFCLCMWSLSCTWQCVRKPKLPRMPQKIKPTENAPFLFQTTSFRYLISSKIVRFGDSARGRDD